MSLSASRSFRAGLFGSGGVKAFVLVAALSFAFSGCSAEDPSDSDSGNTVNNLNNLNNLEPDGGVDQVVDVRPLRVATFNVRRLFDTVCDSGRCGDDDFEDQRSQAEFEFRAQQIADGLAEIDADIVMLQEIENEDGLALINASFEQGPYPVAVLGESGFAASLDVAVLARGELLEWRSYGDRQLTRPDGSTTSFTREFLRVDVLIDGVRHIAFSTHFRSKSNDDAGRRFAEAEAAGEIVAEVASSNPDAVVVLAGDFNDEPGTDSVDALLAAGDLQLLTDIEGYWTFRFGMTEIAIDHVVLGLTDVATPVPGGISVFRGDTVGYAGSDHAAVAADLLVVNP